MADNAVFPDESAVSNSAIAELGKMWEWLTTLSGHGRLLDETP
ncbi:MAG: hypothetical protein ACE5HN_11035 [Nitrospiria bacterium]